MATEKEMQSVAKLVDSAIKVNSSNKQVGVQVDVTQRSVTMRIAPSEAEIAQGAWDWVFYPGEPAYFSDDIWPESLFVERCEKFIAQANLHFVEADNDGVPV